VIVEKFSADTCSIRLFWIWE